MDKVLEEVKQERFHQDKKWGIAHDDNHTPYDWSAFILSYLGDSISDFVKESGRLDSRMRTFRYNMIKVAALAVAAVESIDRKLPMDRPERKE